MCWSTHTCRWQGCATKQPTSRERGSGLTFHRTESHGTLCSSLTHCCSGLSMLAKPHIPSFLLAMLSQCRDREGSLVPSQCKLGSVKWRDPCNGKTDTLTDREGLPHLCRFCLQLWETEDPEYYDRPHASLHLLWGLTKGPPGHPMPWPHPVVRVPVPRNPAMLPCLGLTVLPGSSWSCMEGQWGFEWVMGHSFPVPQVIHMQGLAQVAL